MIHFNFKNIIAAAALAGMLMLPGALKAQDDVSLDPEFGGRLSFSLDKKLAKGLHLSLEEEARMDDNFSSFNRLHTTVGLSYKVSRQLKFGVGYAMINPYSSKNSAFKNARHRLMVDGKYTLQHGDWQFSLKERLQATFRTGDYNAYQHTQPELALKSRLMAKYKGLGSVTPYGYVELRHSLASYAISAVQSGSTWVDDDGDGAGEAGWFINGRKSYLNRVRASLGLDWRIDRRNTLGFYLLADYVNDYVIDANSSGTKLKDYTHETGFVGQIGAQYNFAF